MRTVVLSDRQCNQGTMRDANGRIYPLRCPVRRSRRFRGALPTTARTSPRFFAHRARSATFLAGLRQKSLKYASIPVPTSLPDRKIRPLRADLHVSGDRRLIFADPFPDCLNGHSLIQTLLDLDRIIMRQMFVFLPIVFHRLKPPFLRRNSTTIPFSH